MQPTKGQREVVTTASSTIEHPKVFVEDGTPPTMALNVRCRESALARSLERHAFVAVVLIVTLGFSLRVRGLGSAGFNEDEIQKVSAARAYLHGDFSRNLEHPMLMKSMVRFHWLPPTVGIVELAGPVPCPTNLQSASQMLSLEP